MENKERQPVKRKRKRIVLKKTLFDVALSMLPDREPLGLTYDERTWLKAAGIKIGRAYKEKYERKAETAEKSEFWLFGPQKEKKAVEVKLKVNLYESSFLPVIVKILTKEAANHKKVSLK